MKFWDAVKTKKALAYFTVILAATIISDLLIVSFFGPALSSSASYIFGTTFKENLLSLMFVEGAILLGMGALSAGGFSESGMTRTQGPKAAYDVEKLSPGRPERRREQTRVGAVLMLVGAVLLLMMIIGIFL